MSKQIHRPELLTAKYKLFLLLRIILILPILFLGGCTFHQTSSPLKPDAKTIWNSLCQPNETAPAFRFSFNLLCSLKNGKNYRLAGELWGNTNGHSRLELRTGMKTLIAIAYENNGTCLFYDALRKKAYTGTTQQVLEQSTVPFPFTLQSLASILLGRICEIVPSEYQNAQMLSSGEFLYFFSQEKQSKNLYVRQNGTPIKMETADWQIRWEKWQEIPKLFYFDFANARIKISTQKFTFLQQQYEENTIKLQLPPKIQILPAENING